MIYIFKYVTFTAMAVVLFNGCNARERHYLSRIERVVAGSVRNTENSAGHLSSDDGLLMQLLLSDKPSQILTRIGYTTSYNKDNKLPNWVAWRLTSGRTDGNISRKGVDFVDDESVPYPRAELADYKRSGYDRGHMCPAGDNKWSKKAMEQSFLLTNVCPQDGTLNRGDWNELENACRRWAQRYGEVYVVCGPVIYKGRHRTIGENNVVVPEAFFKVVLCMKGKPKAIGFLYKNMPGNRPMGDYINTVDEVERITGIDLFPSLPDDVERRVEAESDINDW